MTGWQIQKIFTAIITGGSLRTALDKNRSEWKNIAFVIRNGSGDFYCPGTLEKKRKKYYRNNCPHLPGR
jgi:hypothetical protein